MSESHGNSVAAWTGVGIILLGALLVSLGIMFGTMLFWLPGVLAIVVGAVAWVVLERRGYGEKKHTSAGSDNGIR